MSEPREKRTLLSRLCRTSDRQKGKNVSAQREEDSSVGPAGHLITCCYSAEQLFTVRKEMKRSGNSEILYNTNLFLIFHENRKSVNPLV